jgi:predicted nucleic acid-binding protein
MTILDTNVVSELMRPEPEPAVLRWFDTASAADLYVTAITMAEVLHGVELLAGGKRREALEAGAERLFGVVFADHILSFDYTAARAFSVIASSRRRRGKPISDFDAQIAAIARANEAALATRDTADFEGCGIELINPWSE